MGMSQAMIDPETPERHQNERQESGQRGERPPFDTSELDSIPRTTDEDPPYRDWWVVLDTKTR
jgi:hypothetical protein